jgi:hypothetical protein
VPEPAPPPPAAPAAKSTERARIERMTREYLDAMTVPPTVAEEARRLGVGPEAVRTMYAAELLLHYRSQVPENAEMAAAARDSLADLARLGEEGFLAVVANAVGNPHNTSRVDDLAAATWKAGWEARLLERLREGPADGAATAPLRALSGIDSPAVREFLRGALGRYRDHASNFAAASLALARLRETSATSEIADGLARAGAATGLHAALLEALGRMGGDEARRRLVDYVRDRKGGRLLFVALTELARVDPAAARAEAEGLLAGAGGATLAPGDAEAVREFLRR